MINRMFTNIGSEPMIEGEIVEDSIDERIQMSMKNYTVHSLMILVSLFILYSLNSSHEILASTLFSLKDEQTSQQLELVGHPQVHKVTKDVYAITDLFHSGGKKAGVNAGIIFTEKSIIFIDSGMNIASAEFIWKTAAELAGRRENLYLILTHHHSDHVFGMRVFKDKGAKVIAHIGVKEELKDDNGFYKQFIIEMDKLSPEEGDRIYGDVFLTVPDQVIEKDTVLNIDGDEIHLLYTPGHVNDEIVVYHPKSRTLFGGDAIYEGMYPNARFGGQKEWRLWISHLERLKKLEIDLIVPGHGKLSPIELLDRNISYLKTLF